MEKDFIYIALTMVALMTSVMAIMLFYINRRKEQREEQQKTKAELSYMREYFEKQLYEISLKLSKDSDRWKEVNHLLLSYKPQVNESYFDQNRVLSNSFFKNFGINTDKMEVRNNQVFMLTPFYDKEHETFDAVQLACREVGFHCIRGDEEYIKGDIFSYILERMLQSRIIIANLNGRNPNVYYELGIAQAIGKPTLLIAKNLKDIPFDLKSQNIIIYESLSDLNNKLINMFGRLLVREK